METLPKELKLSILTFLDGIDIKNFINAYELEITKIDLIFLLNSIGYKHVKQVLDLQDPKVSFENKYLLVKYINPNLEGPLFFKEYSSSFFIWNSFPGLYYHICTEMLKLSVKHDNREWGLLYVNITNGSIYEEPFVLFSEKFDMYKLMDILDEYSMLEEIEGDFYREMMSQIDGTDNHIMKYLKYTYNKWGDQGYLLFLLRSECADQLRWFLNLDTRDKYKNTRGPVDIPDIEELKDYTEGFLDEDIQDILIEYANKYTCRQYYFNSYTEGVNTINELIEWLNENKEDE